MTLAKGPITLARNLDWRAVSPLRTVHAKLMDLAFSQGMVELASTEYRSTEWDVVRACVHEAGHAAMAACFGSRSRIYFEHGSTGFSAYTQVRDLELRGPSAEWRQIGVAGAVAEHLGMYGVRCRDAEVVRTVACRMSDSDKDMAVGIADPDVQECFARLRRCWSAVDTIARTALKHELAAWGAA